MGRRRTDAALLDYAGRLLANWAAWQLDLRDQVRLNFSDPRGKVLYCNVGALS